MGKERFKGHHVRYAPFTGPHLSEWQYNPTLILYQCIGPCTGLERRKCTIKQVCNDSRVSSAGGMDSTNPPALQQGPRVPAEMGFMLTREGAIWGCRKGISELGRGCFWMGKGRAGDRTGPRRGQEQASFLLTLCCYTGLPRFVPAK